MSVRKPTNVNGANSVFAISYMRFSTPEQGKGDSFRRQVKKAQDWSLRTGIPINTSITDAGVSAFTEIATKLRALLALIKAGKIPRGTYLLVESLDRLSRAKVIEAMPVMLEIIEAGVIIISLIDDQEYSTRTLSDNDSLLYVLVGTMVRAHQESKVKSDRLSAVWANKRKLAAFGRVVMTRRLPAWLRVKGSGRNQVIEAVPERAEIVQRIFRMAIEGLGRRTIVKIFNQSTTPVPTFGKGETWQPSAIKKILSSKAVLGEFQPKRLGKDGTKENWGEPIKQYFPQIVSDADFYRANAAVTSRMASGGRSSDTVVNLLTGLGYCAHCGGRMQTQNKGPQPKGGRYFACSSFVRGAGCNNATRWRVERIEAEILRRGALIDWSRLASEPSPGNDLDAWRAALLDLQKRRGVVNRLVEGGDETLIGRSAALTREINALRTSITKAEEEGTAAESSLTPAQNQELLAELNRKLETASGAELREFKLKLAQVLRSSIVQIKFGRDGVEALYRGILPGSQPPRRMPPISLIRPVPPLAAIEMLSADQSDGASNPKDAFKSFDRLRKRRHSLQGNRSGKLP